MNSSDNTYAEGMAQANKEAKATFVGLIITIVVWCICGFGLSGLDFTIFHTPIWVFTGCICTWICAIIVAVVLSRKVIVDTDLDAIQEVEHE